MFRILRKINGIMKKSGNGYIYIYMYIYICIYIYIYIYRLSAIFAI